MKPFPKKFSSEAFNEEGRPYSDVYNANEVDAWLKELREELRIMGSDRTVLQHGNEAGMLLRTIDRSIFAGRISETETRIARRSAALKEVDKA